jgi:CheY-like chemotaxis protein
MPQTLIERTSVLDQVGDAWILQQKEFSASIAKSILVVEDDAAIRDTLGEFLQEETTHQVFLAVDGETALVMLQTARPNMFLLDYRLPGMNGLELVDRIRGIKEYEQTPIVLMSANIFKEDIIGCNLKYIRKPFDLDNLLQLIEEALT